MAQVYGHEDNQNTTKGYTDRCEGRGRMVGKGERGKERTVERGISLDGDRSGLRPRFGSVSPLSDDYTNLNFLSCQLEGKMEGQRH
jgi:hypothetical protein